MNRWYHLSSRGRAPLAGGVAAIAVALVVYACTGTDETKSEPTSPISATAAQSTGGGENANDNRSRVKAAEATFKWVADLHHAAMVDFRTNRAAWTETAGSGDDAACRVGRAVAEKHAQQYANAGGKAWSTARKANVDRLLVEVKACKQSAPASIYSVARASSPVPRSLSGNLGYYESAIYGAIDAWDGSSDLYDDVWDAMDNVGWQMFLTQDDTDLIGMMVDLTMSSQSDALEVEWTDPEEEVSWDASIFHRHAVRRWPKWLRSVVKVVLADVAAMVTSMTTMIAADEDGDREQQRQDSTWVGVGASVAATASCVNGSPPCSE